MARREGIEVSIGLSEAVKTCNVDVISAYPITPQTHIVEHLSELVADGELDAEFIMVESEQTAMAACIGAAAAGARTFTSTSSQGLQLMSEIVFIAAALRLPIVMAVANRSLSGPLSIWGDHSDIMANRDCGWIQFFVENGQEAHDHIYIAYKVAEDHRVMLPVMVNLDGFSLTHVIEPILLMDEEEIRGYLPPYKPLIQLNPLDPVTMGAASTPAMFTEAKKAQDAALRDSYPVIVEALNEFGRMFGRHYKPVEAYKTEDADLVFVTMGGFSGNAQSAVDQLRAKGQKVGVVKIRVFRPFPLEDILKAVGSAKILAVCDRALSFGGLGGPVYMEMKSAFYGLPNAPHISGFIYGLGGRDVRVEHFFDIADKARKYAEDGVLHHFEMVGLKE